MNGLWKMLATAGAVFALAPVQAAPSLTMTLTDDLTSAFATCSNPGPVNPGCTDVSILTPAQFGASFTGNVGGWSTFLSSGETNSPGAPGGANLNIDQLSLTNNYSATETFTIKVTATGFSTPPGDPLSFFGSASTTSTGDTGMVVSHSYFDPADTGALVNPITCSFNPSTNNSCPEPSISVNNGGGTYSITQILDVTLAAGESINLTGSNIVKGVPEPGTLVLAAGAMLIAAGIGRRRHS
jgi:hypothetical protein